MVSGVSARRRLTTSSPLSPLSLRKRANPEGRAAYRGMGGPPTHPTQNLRTKVFNGLGRPAQTDAETNAETDATNDFNSLRWTDAADATGAWTDARSDFVMFRLLGGRASDNVAVVVSGAAVSLDDYPTVREKPLQCGNKILFRVPFPVWGFGKKGRSIIPGIARL